MEENPEAPAELNAVPAVVNGEKRLYNLPGTDGRFLKGNPGRKQGSMNHATRVRQQLLACVGRQTLRLWKRQLRDPKTVSKAIDQVIALLGPSKPLMVDNSQHTHFTVVVDGSQAGNS